MTTKTSMKNMCPCHSLYSLIRATNRPPEVPRETHCYRAPCDARRRHSWVPTPQLRIFSGSRFILFSDHESGWGPSTPQLDLRSFCIFEEGWLSGFQLFTRVGNPIFASYLGHLPTYLLFLVDFLRKTNLPT